MHVFVCALSIDRNITLNFNILNCSHVLLCHVWASCTATAKFTDGTVEPKIAGNPKKRKKARNAQQQPTISSLMDCYAQQREQCKPGGWKAGYEQQQEELMGGVLDEAMCGALGGGDLNKALSTAFKGAMAQAKMQVRGDTQVERGQER